MKKNFKTYKKVGVHSLFIMYMHKRVSAVDEIKMPKRQIFGDYISNFKSHLLVAKTMQMGKISSRAQKIC